MKNKGFSLVELIVVIAIMAILVGVAVPVYSSYIEKSQKAKDEQMIDEIKHAIEIYGAANFGTATSDYIILTPGDAIAVENGFVDKAMIATFGSNWREKLTLSYDEWTLNSTLISSALNSAYAESVNNSSYVNGSSVSDLLGNVQTVTQAAAGLLGTVVKTEDDYIDALGRVLGDDYLANAATAGILVKNADGSYSMVDGTYDSTNNKVSSDLQTQLSNMMVLSVADEVDGMSSEEMMEILFANEESPYTGDATPAAQLAVKYAFFKAVDLNSPNGSNHFETLNGSLQNAQGFDDVSAAFDEYNRNNSAEIAKYLYADWDGTGEPTLSAMVNTNFEAFGAIMTGVNTVSGNYADAETLKNGELYTSGSVVNDVNGYLGAASVVGKLNVADLPEKGIIVFVSVDDKGACKVTSYMNG